MSSDTITKDGLRSYLDEAIRAWRRKKAEAVVKEDDEAMLIASCYVDAFQSVRISFLGELLPKEG